MHSGETDRKTDRQTGRQADRQIKRWVGCMRMYGCLAESLPHISNCFEVLLFDGVKCSEIEQPRPRTKRFRPQRFTPLWKTRVQFVCVCVSVCNMTCCSRLPSSRGAGAGRRSGGLGGPECPGRPGIQRLESKSGAVPPPAPPDRFCSCGKEVCSGCSW